MYMYVYMYVQWKAGLINVAKYLCKNLRVKEWREGAYFRIGLTFGRIGYYHGSLHTGCYKVQACTCMYIQCMKLGVTASKEVHMGFIHRVQRNQCGLYKFYQTYVV